MIVYRLATPIDEFTVISDWLAAAPAVRAGWLPRAVLALADAGVGWRGDMVHLPRVGEEAAAPCLVVKQQDNGATFAISEVTVPWTDAESALIEEVAARGLETSAPPSREKIAGRWLASRRRVRLSSARL